MAPLFRWFPGCCLLLACVIAPVQADEVDLLAPASPPPPAVILVAAGSDLQAAIDAAPDGARLILEAGDYIATPRDYIDPLCGNCQEHETPVEASTGFTIRGKSLTIAGPSEGIATLHTRAGYGLFIEDAPEVHLVQLTVADGRRDKDGRATDGAIVVRSSRVMIDSCTIGPNPVPAGLLDDVIVGICGVVGREDADIYINDSLITQNTWDGVATYRGAMATLEDVVIDQGRGVGVGITWNSQVSATRVQVSGYWKGIGSFGNSTAVVKNCLVHDVKGWGLIATGESLMQATNCTIARCGNVGIAQWNPEAHLSLTNCISWGNGTEKEWVAPRVGLWWNGDRAPGNIAHCLFGNNTEGDFQWGYDDTADRTWDIEGLHGNRRGHPLFRTPGEWTQVHGSSPIIDAGDPAIRDRDGSISDLGWTGGPEAP